MLTALDAQYLVIGGIFNLLKAASYEVEVEVAMKGCRIVVRDDKINCLLNKKNARPILSRIVKNNLYITFYLLPQAALRLGVI